MRPFQITDCDRKYRCYHILGIPLGTSTHGLSHRACIFVSCLMLSVEDHLAGPDHGRWRSPPPPPRLNARDLSLPLPTRCSGTSSASPLSFSLSSSPHLCPPGLVLSRLTRCSDLLPLCSHSARELDIAVSLGEPRLLPPSSSSRVHHSPFSLLVTLLLPSFTVLSLVPRYSGLRIITRRAHLYPPLPLPLSPCLDLCRLSSPLRLSPVSVLVYRLSPVSASSPFFPSCSYFPESQNTQGEDRSINPPMTPLFT